VQRSLAPFLAVPVIDRTRRNHGLEHATMTLLSQKYRGVVIVGRSTPSGFYLYGNVGTDAVADAAHEALRRMKSGEHYLAVHPNCGTNFVVAGIFAALAAFLGFAGADNWRARWERLPFVAPLVTLALIFSVPVGMNVQREITTSGDMRDLQIVSVRRRLRGPAVEHFVATAD
jgi:hypothetical protein